MGAQTRTSSRLAKAVAATMLVCAGLAAGPRASATAQQDILVSAQDRSVTRTYPAIPRTTPNSGTALTNPTTCASEGHCDTISVDIDPGGLPGYVVVVTLSWPNPPGDENPFGNDLNLAVWDPDPLVPYCCRQSRTTGRETHPEVVTLARSGPDPSSVMLIVDNSFGVNAGYTLQVDLLAPELARTLEPPYGGALTRRECPAQLGQQIDCSATADAATGAFAAGASATSPMDGDAPTNSTSRSTVEFRMTDVLPGPAARITYRIVVDVQDATAHRTPGPSWSGPAGDLTARSAWVELGARAKHADGTESAPDPEIVVAAPWPGSFSDTYVYDVSLNAVAAGTVELDVEAVAGARLGDGIRPGTGNAQSSITAAITRVEVFEAA